HGQEQAELADRRREALVIDRLGDVDVASEVVAFLDLDAVVRRGQHDDWNPLEMLVGLEPSQDVEACHVRQIEVQQDQQGRVRHSSGTATLRENVVERAGPIGEMHDRIADPGPAHVLLDQPRVAGIVLDQQNGDGNPVHAATLLDRRFAGCGTGPGKRTRKTVPWSSTDSHSILPPSRRTSALTCASPMPSPGTDWSPARRNSSKIRSWSLGATPRPLSSTSNTANLPSIRPPIRITPGRPGLRYLRALSSRLPKICSIATLSI